MNKLGRRLENISENDSTIALNVLYIKEMEICPADVSKIKLNYEKRFS